MTTREQQFGREQQLGREQRLGLEQRLGAHPLLAGITEAALAEIAACARAVEVAAGAFLFHEGETADRCYLLYHGRIALGASQPGRGHLVLETLGPGEIVGLSWLIPPYRFAYDGQAMELIRAIVLDAACLRAKIAADSALCCALLRRLVPVLAQRLQGARLQSLDVYGRHR